MKPPDTAGFNRPFEGLKKMLRSASTQLPPAAKEPEAAPVGGPAAASEEEVFAQAMAGVTRLERGRIDPARPTPAGAPADAALDDCLVRLQRLVESGAGFLVCDTPEYIEGVGQRAPPGITRRLHRGDFAVQAHLDLHGHTVEAARELFDAFLRESTAAARSAVLIIHGRGLSSPGEPVLKTKVAQWLGAGRWSKWVVAFASARLCDGGPGATYALLRRRPLAKRRRRAGG